MNSTKKDLSNTALLLKENDIDYYFLPYQNRNNTYLQVIKKDEKFYINFKGISEKTTETTCEIVNVKDEDGNINLTTIFNGKYHTIKLDISADTEIAKTITNLVNGKEIEATDIDQKNVPITINLSIDEGKITTFENEEQLANENLRSRTRKGQILSPLANDIKFGKLSVNGLEQEIDLSKVGFEKNQKFALLNSERILASVSKEGQPVAVFTYGKQEERSDVKLNISKTFLNEFKSKNPNITIPEGTESQEDSNFVTFEIEKFKLSSSLNIEDVQIKGANKDFAIMFSALGCQISDGNSAGKLANLDKTPFDIAISNRFVRDAIAFKNGCELDKTEPAYSAVLISMIHEERNKTKDTNKIVHISLGDKENPLDLYSVPVKLKNGQIEHLNIKKQDGNTFVYMQLSTEQNKRSYKAPKFQEIDEVALEDNSKTGKNYSSVLYIGSKSKGNNVTASHIEIDFEENKNNLIYLKDNVFNVQFNKIQNNFGKIKHIQLDGRDFEVHPIPNEKDATTNLNNVGILSKVGEYQEQTLPETPTILDFKPIKEAETDNSFIATHPIETKPTAEEPEKEDVSAEEPEKEDISAEEPEKEDISAEDNEDKENEDKEDKEDEKEDKPEEKKVSIAEKIGNWKGFNRTLLIGLFALTTVISCLVPVLLPVSIFFMSVTVVNEVAPWKLVGTVKKYKDNQAKEESENLKRKFERSKNKEKLNSIKKEIKQDEKQLKKQKKLENKQKKLENKQKILEIKQNEKQLKQQKKLENKQKKLEIKQKKIDAEEQLRNEIEQERKDKIYRYDKLKQKRENGRLTFKEKREFKNLCTLFNVDYKKAMTKKNNEKIKESGLNDDFKHFDFSVLDEKKEKPLEKTTEKKNDIHRYDELKEKMEKGTLTPEEKAELKKLCKKFKINFKSLFTRHSEPLESFSLNDDLKSLDYNAISEKKSKTLEKTSETKKSSKVEGLEDFVLEDKKKYKTPAPETLEDIEKKKKNKEKMKSKDIDKNK